MNFCNLRTKIFLTIHTKEVWFLSTMITNISARLSFFRRNKRHSCGTFSLINCTKPVNQPKNLIADVTVVRQIRKHWFITNFALGRVCLEICLIFHPYHIQPKNILSLSSILPFEFYAECLHSLHSFHPDTSSTTYPDCNTMSKLEISEIFHSFCFGTQFQNKMNGRSRRFQDTPASIRSDHLRESELWPQTSELASLQVLYSFLWKFHQQKPWELHNYTFTQRLTLCTKNIRK